MKNFITILTLAAALAAPALTFAQEPAAPATTAEAPADPFKVKPEHAEKGTLFYVNDARGRDNVTFTSRAPLEDIIGTTNRITGYIAFDPVNPVAGGAGRFSVPVATLNTGIPLRDEHLQGAQWLNAAAHPEIVIEIESINGLSTVQTGEGFETYQATLVGSLTLNGVTKPIEIPARATYMAESDQTKTRLPGNLLAGRATFNVQLDDHNITGGGNIGPKVSNDIEVQVTFVASDVKPRS
jgi:polyisoprenoid-binding protein YceI